MYFSLFKEEWQAILYKCKNQKEFEDVLIHICYGIMKLVISM
ncbi:hypothetical protein HMPREF9430_00730 [Solobacterium moorei F0204]|uniref:Uncharacterized protein n=1 Tax=Solobacterium moorei F0204 TaxID=706433 RepID=E7MMG3_9FIRM|nr:hypothetical protein HMPREF9430_00730 [Solobacterium moorei F0204]